MNENEEKFREWKESTRREALEKEVKRLKEENEKITTLLKKIRTGLIITGLIILSSYALIFYFYLPPQTATNERTEPPSNPKEKQDSTFTTNKRKPSETASMRQLKILAPVSDTAIIKIPPDGLYFSIQTGAYLSKDLSPFEKNMISLHQDSSSGINQFTLGVFSAYEDAQIFRKEVEKLGFKDAYITAGKNGQRINLKEALNQRSQAKIQ